MAAGSLDPSGWCVPDVPGVSLNAPTSSLLSCGCATIVGGHGHARLEGARWCLIAFACYNMVGGGGVGPRCVDGTHVCASSRSLCLST
nr:hypothetical protein Iba_chr01bCG5950 [Ipomoea batatas]